MKPGLHAAPLLALMIAACSNAPVAPPSAGHLDASPQAAPAADAGIPQPVQNTVTPPKPQASAKVETYSVVVNNVRVQDLLFALARDAKVNVDVHPGINGTVTLNAIDQTLPQLLTRIAKQVDMRWEMDGPNLVVMPDSPYLRTYRVDYVNMSRDTTGNVAINTQIASVSPTAAGSGAGAAAGGTSGNISSTKVDNVAKNHFWETLEKNIKDILREEDKTLWEIKCERQTAAAANADASATGTRTSTVTTSGSGPTSVATGPGTEGGSAGVNTSGNDQQACGTFQERASVIANPESGILAVRASLRQHERIQEFLDIVLTSAKRQVLIEATIVEVGLSKNYQQGIDWQYFNQGSTWRAAGQGGTTRTFRVNPTTGAFEATTNVSTLPSAVGNTLFSAAFKRGDFLAAIKLLENFGTLKVLSSPKLSVLNNQTAMLKVVDNVVYFQVKADTTQNQTGSLSNFTTTPQSVSVGLVMSVTPQISESNTVIINVRPTISRIIGNKRDPHPSLPSDIPNLVPEIQTREMESLMSVNNGDIAVLGGLMQDQVNNTDDAVPGLWKIPFLGNLFTHRNDTTTKTELVIFLRPTVIKDSSIEGDYSSFRARMPKKDFFDGTLGQSSRHGAGGGAQ